MPATLIIGSQWGDEGKAKVIDYLSEKTDIVVRYQGGANAGHTVIVKDQKYVFHLIPSGILYDNIICVLGGGMVLDPTSLFDEIQTLEDRGIDTKNRIRIAENAHLVLPWHQTIDAKREEMLGSKKIGTTKRGIGVCYGDKVNRWGIRMADIQDDDFYNDRLPVLVEQKNNLLTKVYDSEPIKQKELENYLREIADKTKSYLINTPYYLNKELASGKNVLLEGAQGTMLDIDYGTYPFVTSSNPTTGGALVGSGISFQYLKEVVGISKAYTTRVGEGPFPTEMFGEEGEELRQLGSEFGATTGRPRRCGWYDAEVIKHASRLNGLTSIALTKLDVFDTMKTIKIGVGYELDGKRIDYFPAKNSGKVKVIYEEFEGWQEPTTEARTLKQLPKRAKKYLQALEKFTGVPIKWVSVGPERDSTIKIK